MCLCALVVASISAGDDPVRALLSGDVAIRKDAARAILNSKDKSYIPSLLEIAFHYTATKDLDRYKEVNAILQKLTGENRERYFQWLQWIGAHPEIALRPDYLAVKKEVLSTIDPAFASFFHDEESLRIRAEEIVWGGVKKDGIPALKNPPHIPASKASYLRDSDRVFGVALENESRAYPLKIMDWHEMANDVVGGMSVSLSYCTLCGSAILYNGRIGDQTFTFGSSGLLYRSNKLMYDHQTESLWSELQGVPVVGKLANRKIKLEVLPIVTTTWGEWRRRHPETTVLSIETGFQRDYDTGPYKQYFESKDLMFPVPVLNDALQPKDFVFALRVGGAMKAYPLDLLLSKKILRDRVGEMDVVLVAETEGKSVRAYRCEAAVDSTWKGSEESIVSPDGVQKCPRLPGHLAYWFGWYAQFPDTPLYKD